MKYIYELIFAEPYKYFSICIYFLFIRDKHIRTNNNFLYEQQEE